MSFRKFFGKWLIVIVIMGIGIGTFGALYMRGEERKAAEEQQTTEAPAQEEGASGSTATSPESYLTNQRKHDINLDYLAEICGEYQAAGDESRWHLMITAEHEGDGPYLSVYDSESGDPGFEGRIMYLKDGLVIAEINQDLFKQMPADWKPEGEGKYAILDVTKSFSGVDLGYRGSVIQFAPGE